jgi:hypothetical protein
MENESMTLPRTILDKYRKPIFIETGTWDGRTVQMALDAGCEQVISIETDPTLHGIARDRFVGNDKVKLQQGESVFWLGIILPQLKTPPLVWLDAHMQESYKGGSVIVPLLDELEMFKVNLDVIKNSTIMIDDMRCVGKSYGWERITIEQILTKLFEINKDYIVVYEDSKAAPRDIMVAYLREGTYENG